MLLRSLGHYQIKSNWHVKKSQVIGLGEVVFDDVMENNDILCIGGSSNIIMAFLLPMKWFLYLD
jgi:hypothetical protein